MGVRDAHPELIPADEALLEAHQQIATAYRGYVRNVSPRQMAISYETACYVYALCKMRRPARIIEFGSGFSSYMLRRYQTTTDGCAVVSVDDSAEWLRWSAQFCETHGLEADGFHLWPDYPPGPYDLVVYDFGSGEFRNEHFATATALVAPDGLIVYDDAQHVAHHAHMRQACAARRMDLFSVEEWTLDEWSRFAAVGIHTKASR